MREFKFKAKLKCNDGKYRWFEDTGTVFHRFQQTCDLKPDTICQLITKIGDVEIYEYDCWYNTYNKKISYLYYSKTIGSLKVNINFNYTINNPYEYLGTFYKQVKKNKLIFIGNWHDGEEYLLSKIKEITNE